MVLLWASQGQAGYQRVKSFGYTNLCTGATSHGKLIEGPGGALYGTAWAGGSAGKGVVFRLNKNGTGYTNLHNFTGTSSDGAKPYPAGLLQGTDGALYGTTQEGGSSGLGVVFKLNSDGSGYTNLHSFTGSGDGWHPWARLLEGSDGALYGTTEAGGTASQGIVFKLNKNGTGYTQLHNFTAGSDDGSSPTAGLVEGSDGALYGTTSLGGSADKGLVFRLNKNGTGYTNLHSFTGGVADGVSPYAGLVQASDGALYGTTTSGGITNASDPAGLGTVYRLNTNGSGYTNLHNFAGATGDGARPYAELLVGSDGALYGTTDKGGSGWTYGTVFKLNKNGSGFTVLHNFTDSRGDGAWPLAALVEGSDGALYGTTVGGGSTDDGTVFKLNKNGSGYTVLRSFTRGGGDACGPLAGLLRGSDGALYGTTPQGGSGDYGTVFRMNQDGSGYTLLRSFTWSVSDGAEPFAGLLEGSDGALYGTTVLGGSGLVHGAVFKMNKNGSGYTNLHSFTGSVADGRNPYAPLIEGSDGALYGTTGGGGSADRGTAFKLNKNGSGYQNLYSFKTNGIDGWYSRAPLVEGSEGLLYGTTYSGGTANQGTLFKLSKNGGSFTVVHTFTGSPDEGAYLRGGVVEGADGVLYGTTYGGGSAGMGTVFKVNKDGTGFAILHHFLGGYNDGANPMAGLIQGSDSALYGSTDSGGTSYDCGTVFGLRRNGSDYTVLRSFSRYGNDGARPQGPLVELQAKGLYGTTWRGGDMDLGTVFLLSLMPAPPRPIFGAPMHSNGVFSATLTGSERQVYEILTSTNLLHWQHHSYLTNVAKTVPFIDPSAGIFTRWFYRARLVP